MFHEKGNLRQRTREFARVYRALPVRDRIAQIWGDQLVRAGSSIGANYREAQRARSIAEHRARLGDCLREADETLYWVELIELENLVPSRRLSAIKQELDELIAIFVSLLR